MKRPAIFETDKFNVMCPYCGEEYLTVLGEDEWNTSMIMALSGESGTCNACDKEFLLLMQKTATVVQ